MSFATIAGTIICLYCFAEMVNQDDFSVKVRNLEITVWFMLTVRPFNQGWYGVVRRLCIPSRFTNFLKRSFSNSSLIAEYFE